jgi:hypothetical protein
MSSSANETGGSLELPKPIVEPAGTANSVAETAPAAPEQAATVGQSAPSARPATPIAAPPIMLPLPPMPQTDAPQNDIPVMTQDSASAIVDDGDLIEKEWVNKAKLIVERNRDDPYKQSEELTVFKADYLKKRYDKSIKLSQ